MGNKVTNVTRKNTTATLLNNHTTVFGHYQLSTSTAVVGGAFLNYGNLANLNISLQKRYNVDDSQRFHYSGDSKIDFNIESYLYPNYPVINPIISYYLTEYDARDCHPPCAEGLHQSCEYLGLPPKISTPAVANLGFACAQSIKHVCIQ